MNEQIKSCINCKNYTLKDKPQEIIDYCSSCDEDYSNYNPLVVSNYYEAKKECDELIYWFTNLLEPFIKDKDILNIKVKSSIKILLLKINKELNESSFVDIHRINYWNYVALELDLKL